MFNSFQIFTPQNTDIVILDSNTSYEIHKCLPKRLSVTEIEFRNKYLIIFNLRYLYYFFYFFYRSRKIKYSLILSLIKIKKPKVVITCFDNNEFIGLVGVYFPEIKNIAIQNGLRSLIPIHNWINIKYFPILLGFGNHELKLINKINGTIRKYYPVGSLKYGIYKSDAKKTNNLKISDEVIFISTWRENFENNISGNREIHSSSIIFFKEIINILKDNNLKLRIMPKYEKSDKEYLKEISYFNKLLNLKNNNNSIFLNKSEKYDQYKFCDKSRIIISFNSTLAFEMLGAKKKVLFLGSEKKIIEKLGWQSQFLYLPPQIKVENDLKSELNQKLSYLIKMDDEEYQKLIKKCVSEYMFFQKEWPHEIIKQKISGYFNFVTYYKS